MIIRELVLENFQAHAQKSITFDDGVNCLVGETDAGKSSIIRALRWVLLNELKSEPIRFGSKSCSVAVVVQHETDKACPYTVVRRVKSASKNEYYLDKKKFVSFGTTVPDEIKDLLNLSPASFQMQADPTFLLSETAGQVSKELNRFVALDAIDASMGEAEKRAKHETARVGVFKEELQAREDAVVAFPEGLGLLKDQFDYLKDLDSELDYMFGRWNSINDALTELHGLGIPNLKKEEGAADRISCLTESIFRDESRYDEISDLCDDYETAVKESKAHTVNFSLVEGSYLALRELEQKRTRTSLWISRFEEAFSDLETALDDQVTADNYFHEQSEGQICPLCETVVSHEKREN